ncbi:MAG: hypothetical protein OXG51_16815 [Gammaproteobacteria bacterium]|nr:hypothetical protein [Gammaproteobacteria bacterium]
MRRVVREIDSMSERLEESGLKSQQSRAVIEAIANSIEKFAVTPERLSAEFERHTESLMKTMIGWQIATVTLFAGALTGLVGVLVVRL